MFTISSQSDYGLIIISSLLKKKVFVPLSDLVQDTKLPQRFLARIGSELANHGLLKSLEGRNGGYKLTEKVKNINLYEYLTIFESDVEVCKCCEVDYDCQYKGLCRHGNFLQSKLNKIIIDQLKKIMLVDIFK